MSEIKVKTFWAWAHIELLEKDIEDWLKENPNIEIISTSQSSSEEKITAIVYYKKK